MREIVKSSVVFSSIFGWSRDILVQECIPVGCVPSAAVAIPGEGSACWGVVSAYRGCLPSEGVYLPSEGVYLPSEGVCLPGGYLPGGICLLPAARRNVCLPGGVCLPGEVSVQGDVCHHPSPNGQNDRHV